MSLYEGRWESELGRLPNDWKVLPLGSCLTSPPAYGINAPSVKFQDGLPPYLRITDITDDGRFEPRPLVCVNSPLSSRYQLKENDIVFARTGASVGKSWKYDATVGPLIFAGFLIRVSPDPTCLLSSYVAAYFSTQKYWTWVKANSMRSGQPGINGTQYSKLPIPVPPLIEQRAIANVLSDVDALIAGLEKLIEKKRNIKQATMQQLLTGKTRLPGFTEEWEVKHLNELGIFLKGTGVRKDEANSGSLPCIRYGEIYTHHSEVVQKFNSWINKEVARSALPLKTGDLLFAASGETKEEIGKCTAYIGSDSPFAGGDIIVFRAMNIDPIFMSYLCNSKPVVVQKASLGQGDAVVHISAISLGRVSIKLPKLEEQKAIATLISGIDTELYSIEARLLKIRNIKQGMMQELLTGRTRLI